MQTQEILHLPGTSSPTSELSSKARLPYTCITGYTTTPLYNMYILVRNGFIRNGSSVEPSGQQQQQQQQQQRKQSIRDNPYGQVDRSSIFGHNGSSNDIYKDGHSESHTAVTSSSSKVSSFSEASSRQTSSTEDKNRTHDDLGLPIPERLAAQPPPSSSGGVECTTVERNADQERSLDSREVISKLSSFDLESNKFTIKGAEGSQTNSNGTMGKDLTPGIEKWQLGV